MYAKNYQYFNSSFKTLKSAEIVSLGGFAAVDAMAVCSTGFLLQDAFWFGAGSAVSAQMGSFAHHLERLGASSETEHLPCRNSLANSRNTIIELLLRFLGTKAILLTVCMIHVELMGLMVTVRRDH